MEEHDLLIPGLQDYIDALIPKRDEILTEMEVYAQKKGFPIIGPLVGQLLMQYARIIKARRILELGSGYGYSAIWFARATSDDAEIICTEGSETNAKLARSYFEKAGVAHKIKFYVGDGLSIMTQLQGKFDIIFNDVDKEEYPSVFKIAVKYLKRGGLLITDNTLWYGKVREAVPKEESTRGVKEYNRLAFSDSSVFSTIIPIRDGVTVSLRL
ncbi:MAG: O-methyltransferase [Candidatus Hodarchaeota archaeon]